MKIIKSIGNIRIAKKKFVAQIIRDENNLEAFAVFLADTASPIILFKQNPTNSKVEIDINFPVLESLSTTVSSQHAVRSKILKRFISFVINSENTAKELVFSDTRLSYIADIKKIKQTEKQFLLFQSA